MTTGARVYRPLPDDSCAGSAAVTPHDTNELPTYSRKLYIGTSSAGALKVTMLDGQVTTFAAIAVGWHPLAVKLVWSTGTTVSNIVAAW